MTKDPCPNSNSIRFDPFSDRCSRDIRNLLSEAFIRSVDLMDAAPYEEAASVVMAEQPQRVYRAFIETRLKIYNRAFDHIRAGAVEEPRRQALILWNHGLFFEVHELLESLWLPTKGKARQGLKGLIQAAGVYVHLEQGNRKAATGLARRALGHLKSAGDGISFIGNLAVLIQKLERLDITPPDLTYSRSY